MYGVVYGPVFGVVAAVLVGVPVTVAAACLGKALEIAVVLRCSLRARGAVLGLMGWAGYTAMFLLIFAGLAMPQLVGAIGPYLEPLGLLP